MYSYDSLREKQGRKVSQTVDAPIMIMDLWELTDVFIAIGIVLFFGVILGSWLLMFLLLGFCLIGIPIVKRNNPKGILLHWPYKKIGMSLPGMINPGSGKKFSN